MWKTPQRQDFCRDRTVKYSPSTVDTYIVLHLAQTTFKRAVRGNRSSLTDYTMVYIVNVHVQIYGRGHEHELGHRHRQGHGHGHEHTDIDANND
jgi:hypothetical protein